MSNDSVSGAGGSTEVTLSAADVSAFAGVEAGEIEEDSGSVGTEVSGMLGFDMETYVHILAQPDVCWRR
jgi:hypothetical protein